MSLNKCETELYLSEFDKQPKDWFSKLFATKQISKSDIFSLLSNISDKSLVETVRYLINFNGGIYRYDLILISNYMLEIIENLYEKKILDNDGLTLCIDIRIKEMESSRYFLKELIKKYK